MPLVNLVVADPQVPNREQAISNHHANTISNVSQGLCKVVSVHGSHQAMYVYTHGIQLSEMASILYQLTLISLSSKNIYIFLIIKLLFNFVSWHVLQCNCERHIQISSLLHNQLCTQRVNSKGILHKIHIQMVYCILIWL